MRNNVSSFCAEEETVNERKKMSSDEPETLSMEPKFGVESNISGILWLS